METNILITSFFFILGLLIGSFLNAAIYRTETKKSLRGRSFCPHCKHQLSFWDLVPIFSYLFLRGRCRYCKKSISPQYPLVELATGILFAAISLKFILPTLLTINNTTYQIPNTLYFILYSLFLLFISAILVFIFTYDLKHSIIPDKIVVPAILISLVAIVSLWGLNALSFPQNAIEIAFSAISRAFFGVAAGAGLFFLLVFVSKGKWMGGGDVKLGILMGLFLGFPNILVALFFAFLTGALVGLALIALRLKKFGQTVPFGPFLVAATFFALFFGGVIISLYLSLLI